MREIKFRIYSKDYGMQYPERYLLSAFDFGVATDHYIDDSTSFYPITDKDNVLMQYTGLKDKNGKEIYEGDIVTRLYNVPWVVKYTHKGFRALPSIDSGLYFDYSDFNDCEVIGNIYENPELL